MKKSAFSKGKALHLHVIIPVLLIVSFFTMKSVLIAGTDFTAQPEISGESAYCVATAKINNDDYVDIVAALNEKKQIVWYKNDGDGNFDAGTIVASDTDNIQFIHVDDVNNDGAPDVLAALYGRPSSAPVVPGKIILYQNNPANKGTFSSGTVIDQTDCNGAKGIYTADLDNDTDIDIISASYLSGKVAWYEQDNGSFTKRDTFSFPKATCVITTDIDGDSDLWPDIVASSGSGDKIVWFKNNKDGTFTNSAYTISNTAAGSTALIALDLNDDGKKDIISASGDNGDSEAMFYTNENGEKISLEGPGAGKNIEWYLNSISDPASDVFPEKKIIAPDADRTSSVLATLINEDAQPDLVFNSITDGSLYYCIGKGHGTQPDPNKPPYNPFEAPKLITDDVGSVKSVASADIDGDGDRDLVSASYRTSSRQGMVKWFKNVSGYIITPITGNTTEQNEGTATFTVRLDTQPKDNATVTLPVESNDTSEGTVSAPKLVFTASNWETPQTVTVTGVNDSDDDSDQTYKIILGPASSLLDLNYNGTDPDDITLENIDNDDEYFTDGGASGTNTGGGGGGCFINTVK